ncbi:MAG: phosphoglycerate dehydrogenase, partial [Candidatus Eiseniibacteriota bacterium]
MKRIVILDPISEDAARRLEQETGWKVEQHVGLGPAELLQAVENADVLIVRSSTKLTREVLDAAKRLKVIGRAGIGVDNIDM